MTSIKFSVPFTAVAAKVEACTVYKESNNFSNAEVIYSCFVKRTSLSEITEMPQDFSSSIATALIGNTQEIKLQQNSLSCCVGIFFLLHVSRSVNIGPFHVVFRYRVNHKFGNVSYVAFM